VRHDDNVTTAGAGTTSERLGRLARSRGGPVLGLLFLIGPLSDFADASLSLARMTTISVTFAAFVALYLVLLPPAPFLRRRGPRAIRGGLVLLAATAGLTLALGAPRSFAVLFVYVVAAAGLLLPPRGAAVVVGGTAAVVGAVLAVSGADGSTVAAYTLTTLAVGAMMAAFAGQARANRELREAREELARLAVVEERARIARDLHDLLGHTLSVIALKSELAAKLAVSDPIRAQAEMADVQRVTRQALAEVREAVQGYRRLALTDAVDGARAALSAAGIACQVRADAAELPSEVEELLAWAVREGATNVLRHSGARACEIRLFAGAGAVALQIDDDGAPAPSGAGGGAGLAGLRERASRLDGTVEAGARAEGGFRLRMTVPLPAS
jgi:two-component system sensor histidine kinase DesK